MKYMLTNIDEKIEDKFWMALIVKIWFRFNELYQLISEVSFFKIKKSIRNITYFLTPRFN